MNHPALDERIEELEDAASFHERYEQALHNPNLARNIGTYQRNWRGTRDRSLEEIDFEQLRVKFKGIKTHVTDDLDAFLAQFTEQAERTGAKVHTARTAVDAVDLVRQICEQHGTKLIVKSKSMVSEEVELNHELAPHGIEVVETDLGEWIVQKGGERPSHIVGPALHLGRQQVGELLNRVLDKPVSLEDIPEQVRTIRNEIRPAFFEAGVGMTGANALIAESGTVMIVTNEGNGRLAGSIPPVQIVLAGIEKIVPTYDDAMTQLRLLARSATGQRLTVYTTFMTGPTPGHEMHIILVDNGRRMMRSMPEFVDALHCIRCGACSNVCPPYGEVSGHVFGHIYSGAIGLVVSGFHHGLESIAKAQSLCLSCNACETVCPASIPLPQQILDVRKMVAEANGMNPKKEAVLEVYSRPWAVDAVTRLGGRLSGPIVRKGMIRTRKLPIVNRQTRWRSLPVPAAKPLRDLVPTGSSEEAQPARIPSAVAGKTVAIFPGCMTDRLYPEQGMAIVQTMRALGVRLVYPGGLNCCGLPASNMGDEPTARKMAQQTIEAMENALARTSADYIVSGSASCVAMLTQDYLHIFRNELTWQARAKRLADKTMDFTSFLTNVAQIPPGTLASDTVTPVVTYHDSCQGLNALGLTDEPREILVDLLGCELRELEGNRTCCGFGGAFGFDYPEISERLMKRKLDNAQATDAPLVVSDNQGCIMHLRGGCDAEGRSLKVAHIAELVAARIEQLSPEPGVRGPE
ncbi:MAG: LUD domain-containing protein [Thermomicrobiales bacterium]|nr:LUD domain-containing protein [Thermomicrobiales bacterium]